MRHARRPPAITVRFRITPGLLEHHRLTMLVRCFISSPGDVAQERLLSLRVLDRLRGVFGARLQLEPIFWEHEPLRATAHFQEQIIPPSQADIVVCILWSRLGTRLPEGFRKPDGGTYSSGTEWELEDAMRSYRERGTPDLLVYRKTSLPAYLEQDEQALLARLQQRRALEAFIDRWFGNPNDGFRAAFHTFQSPDEFEQLLETHLSRLLEDRLSTVPWTEEVHPTPVWHRGSPFRGLQAFDIEHAPVFFGRTAAIAKLKELLSAQAAAGHAFALVLGGSGVGKSSLVCAGLVPTIIQPGVVEGVGLWRWCVFRPSEAKQDLCDGLAAALCAGQGVPELNLTGFDAQELAQLLREAPQRVAAPLRGALRQAADTVRQAEKLPHPPEARLLVVIDQLEEIFTRPGLTVLDRTRFVGALAALAQSGLAWVTATMRSDFYPRIAELPQLVSLKEPFGQFDLLPPTMAEIGQMIQHPARAAGLRFEVHTVTGVALDQVLQEAAADDPQALPLLEFTLDELYKRRTTQDVLTFAAYEQLGQLAGAVGRRAEDVYNGLPADVREALPCVAAAVVRLRENDFSVAAARTPLARFTDPAERQLVEAFVAARLFVTDRSGEGEPTVRLAHEALLRQWPRLAAWVRENQDFLVVRARVASAASRWREEGHSREYLLAPGKPLAEAEDLLSRWSPGLEPPLADYIRRSMAHAASARRRRAAWRLGIGAAFVAVVTAFGAFSYIQWGRAEAERKIAQTQSVVAESQRSRAEEQFRLAQQQRDEANRQRRIAEERSQFAQQQQSLAEERRRLAEANERRAVAAIPLAALQDWLAYDVKRAIARLEEYPVDRRDWEWRYVWRLCHAAQGTFPLGGPIWSISFEPEGTRVAIAYGDSKAQGVAIFDWDSGERLFDFQKHTGPVREVVFTARDGLILSASEAEVLLWQVDDGTVARTIPLVGLTHTAFSRNGRYVAAGKERPFTSIVGKDGAAVVIWDLNLPADVSPRELPVPGWNVLGLSFSADERWLAAAYEHERIMTWDLADFSVAWQGPDVARPDPARQIFALAFDPAATHLAAGRLDGQILVWKWRENGPPWNLRGHASGVVAVAFAPRGDMLASTGWDESVRIWDGKDGFERQSFRGHTDWCMAVAFSPSGNSVISGGRDGVARLWSVLDRNQQARTLDGDVYWISSVAFHPNGRRLATARLDGTLRVWQTATGFPSGDLQGRRLAIYSPDGGLLASVDAEDDDTLLIWNLDRDRQQPWRCKGHGGYVVSAAFSPDSQWVLSGGTDGRARLWNTATGTVEATFEGTGGPAAAIAFFPDGGRAAVGHGSGLVRIWNVAEHRALAELHGHPPTLHSLAVDSRGDHVVAVGGEFGRPGSVTVFDTHSGNVLHVLQGHTNVVSCVAFHPSGRRLATGSYDRTVKLWDPDTGLEAITLRGHSREVTCLGFSGDGNQLATGGRDGTVRIWEAPP